MQNPPLPDDEARRLQAVHGTDLLDSPPEQLFDDFTRIAARLCDTPVALISIVDETRQWFKSRHGLDLPETPREYSFCAHAIVDDGPLVVEDTLRDERFSANPLVTDEPRIRFYAGVPIKTSEGHALGTLCVIDHKPRRIYRETLDLLRGLARQVELHITLRRVVGDLARANQELHRLRELQNEFVAVTSHDLRAPLTAVMGFAGLLESKPDALEDKREHYLHHIMEGGREAIRLTSNLLDVSRLTNEVPVPKYRPVEIGSLVAGVVYLYAGAAALRHIEVATDLPEDLPVLRVDSEMIERSVTNLLANALRHSPSGSRVSIRAQTGPEEVTLWVRDRGPGIPDSERERLFTRYGQLGNAAPGGTGLGLYIVRRFVEAHGGRVGFEEPPDGGAAFYVVLPRGVPEGA